MSKICDVSDVVRWRLCIGCGACAYICPSQKIDLVDFPKEGIRPIFKQSQSGCTDCTDCVAVCPSVQADFGLFDATTKNARTDPEFDEDFRNDWGAVLEIWEGYAADESIRFKGSSGGALTALSAYCLEKLQMHGVLHIEQNPEDPLRNRTRMSRNREELTAATGSRYSPASVCDHLGWVEQAPAPCVIIGKPAEIAAVRNAQRLRQALSEKVGVTLSFFCAESPSTMGTVDLLKKMGVAPESVTELRYRGNGWPGNFAPLQKGKTEAIAKLTYRESWAFLQAYRPWSVHLWPDSTGELADITCGDPWYEEPDGKNPGFSMIVVRTEKGKQIVHGAMESGYIRLQRAAPWKLRRSQQGLIQKKGAVWGRLFARKICGMPVPKFSGVDLFKCWRQLSVKEKLQSTVGTIRRIIGRKLYKPLHLEL